VASERTFKILSPHMRGEDIREFQRDLTARFKAWDINANVKDDGDYGTKTRDATKRVCRGLGILHVTAMKHGVTPELRAKIRDPDKRTAREKERSESPAIKEFRAKLRERFKDSSGALSDVRVTATAGKPHWGGSNDVMTGFVEPFMTKRGLPLGSGKRTPAQNLAAGGSKTSDHLTTKRATAARDFPTFAGEDDARALAKAMGITSWRPNDHTTFPLQVDGRSFRVQILWGAAIDHGDHVHVGISRT
jgi:hypothetical protein